MVRRVAAALSSLVLVLSACGGGEEPAPGQRAPLPVASGSAAPPPTSASEVEPETVTVSKTFWYAGFQVAVRTASLQNGQGEFGDPAPVVALVANFKNVGADTATFGGDLVLRSAGRNYFKTGREQDLPEVPGGADQDGTALIVVDSQFRLRDAELVVGSSDKNQARITLGGAQTVESLEPRSVPMTMKLATAPFTLAVRGGELRADEPRYHRQLPAGKRLLKVSFTGSSAGCPLINYRLSLGLPDGTTVDASESGDALALDNFMSFLLSDSPGGAYTLRLKGGALGSSRPECPESFAAEAPFTIN